MSKKMKTVLYWLSIVGPLADSIIGLIKGCVKGYYDAKLQAMQEWNIEQQVAFRNSFKEKGE